MRPVVLAFLVAACATTTSPTTTLSTGDLVDPEVQTVTLDGRELAVAVVSTQEDRSQGLRGVDDLGTLDGMLFTWERDDVTSRFTMEDTLIDLDIFFFDARGRFVDGLTMVPCAEDPCPTYGAASPYTYALETPAGRFADVGPGSVLDLGG
ncbi:MAG: DUF192 domain-containing protein [Acidimicrobiia bacterium]|nr:DUF192 domain-containing protein [Acidimicrobiia bacterium]